MTDDSPIWVIHLWVLYYIALSLENRLGFLGFFSWFFMSLVVLEWVIGVLCGKTAETEVNNIHSWKWVALLFSVLVWGVTELRGFEFCCCIFSPSEASHPCGMGSCYLVLRCWRFCSVFVPHFHLSMSLHAHSTEVVLFHALASFPALHCYCLLLGTRLIVGALCCPGSASVLSNPVHLGLKGWAFSAFLPPYPVTNSALYPWWFLSRREILPFLA